MRIPGHFDIVCPPFLCLASMDVILKGYGCIRSATLAVLLLPRRFELGGVSIVLLVFPCIVFSSLGFFWVFEYLHLGLVFVQ